MDGNYDTRYASIDEGTAWPWLEVQLANRGLVQDVRIFDRQDHKDYCGGRLKYAEIRVGESRLPLNHRGPISIKQRYYLCGRYSGSAWDGKAVRFSCGVPRYAEYVTVQLMIHEKENTILSLQEIEIYGKGIRYIILSD